MKQVSLVAILSILSWAQVSFGEGKSVTCTASGKSVSVRDGGVVTATATLSFVEEANGDGQRVLTDINGEIKSADTLGDFEEPYTGYFKAASLTENPDYHPHRYVGFSQFKNFDAADTTGSREPGMWGQFLLEKNTSKPKFRAHYIFQAGDHMGGTLHLVCRYH